MKQLNVEEILKKNPQVDVALLGENEKKIAQARKLAKLDEYGLELPFGGRRLTAQGGQHQTETPTSRLRV